MTVIKSSITEKEEILKGWSRILCQDQTTLSKFPSQVLAQIHFWKLLCRLSTHTLPGVAYGGERYCTLFQMKGFTWNFLHGICSAIMAFLPSFFSLHYPDIDVLWLSWETDQAPDLTEK